MFWGWAEWQAIWQIGKILGRRAPNVRLPPEMCVCGGSNGLGLGAHFGQNPGKMFCQISACGQKHSARRAESCLVNGRVSAAHTGASPEALPPKKTLSLTYHSKSICALRS